MVIFNSYVKLPEGIFEACLPTFMIPGVSIKPSAAGLPGSGWSTVLTSTPLWGAKRGGMVMTTIRNYHGVSQIVIYIYICRIVNPYWNNEYSDYDYIHCSIFLWLDLKLFAAFKPWSTVYTNMGRNSRKPDRHKETTQQYSMHIPST